ncbi:MAG: response regulator [Planctomycetes bacterium]|nr:response regulator [Planctomycetota bacterium]
MREDEDRVKVLLVEDNPDDALILRQMLEVASPGRYALRLAENLSNGIRALWEEGADVVLLDLCLPDSGGLDTLERMRRAVSDAPVVVLTGAEDDGLGPEAVRRGAQDFLRKDSLEGPLLVHAVEFARERHRMTGRMAAVLEELRSREEDLWRLSRNSADAILVLDPNQNVLFGNPAAEELFGRRFESAEEEVVDVPCGGVEATEMRVSRPDGTERTAEVRVVEIDWQGRAARLATIRDVTDRRKAEARVRESEERVQSLREDYFRIATHDFLAPLATVQGVVELIQGLDPGDHREVMDGYLQLILEQVRHLHGLARDFMDVESLADGGPRLHREALPPAGAVREALRDYGTVAASAGVSVTEAVEEGLPPLWADRERVHQVLSNLVSNALRHTPRGGGVTLRAARHPQGLCLSVEDTGEGIPLEEQGQIFDRYHQVRSPGRRRHGGAGLGLAICRQVVEAHGGKIWVESVPGEGSAFRFTLPAAGRPVLRVLVVDDDPDVLELLRRFFVGLGDCEADIHAARTGPEAVSILSYREVDLVLCDCRLPGLDGFELLHMVKSTHPSLPVWMMTAYGDLYPAGAMLGMGADRYLAKPFRFPELQQLVAGMLSR